MNTAKDTSYDEQAAPPNGPSRMELFDAAVDFALVAERRYQERLDDDEHLTEFHLRTATQTVVTVAMSALEDDQGPIGQALGMLLKNREAIAHIPRCEPEYRELTSEAYELRQLIWRLIKEEYCEPAAA
ncbi:MAG: hypothetical protein AAFU41_08330 [Pseudomonadota bacterium]